MSPMPDLTKYDDDFKAAEAPASSSDAIPDGKQEVTVATAQISESKAGNPMVKWNLVINGEKYDGRHLFRNNVIGSKEQIAWLKKDLQTAGVKIEKLSDLNKMADADGYIGALANVRLRVTVKNKADGNQNVYIDRLLPGKAEPKPVDPKSADVPF